MGRCTGSAVLERHGVTVSGVAGGQPIVFGHGFGTDQNMWRILAPDFTDIYRTVLFDYVGHGPAVDPCVRAADRYGTLAAYADDLLHICRALDLADVIFVGHSVSGIIGALAANRDPNLFAGLVLIGASPRYINDGDYIGGYTAGDIADILDTIDNNFVSWSRLVATAPVGDPVPDAAVRRSAHSLVGSLVHRFALTDERIARKFARATFLSDHRADLPDVRTPTLVLHCSGDTLVPRTVGEYVARHIPDSRFELITANGHFPHLTAPSQTTAALRRFLQALSAGRR